MLQSNDNNNKLIFDLILASITIKFTHDLDKWPLNTMFPCKWPWVQNQNNDRISFSKYVIVFPLLLGVTLLSILSAFPPVMRSRHYFCSFTWETTFLCYVTYIRILQSSSRIKSRLRLLLINTKRTKINKKYLVILSYERKTAFLYTISYYNFYKQLKLTFPAKITEMFIINQWTPTNL